MSPAASAAWSAPRAVRSACPPRSARTHPALRAAPLSAALGGVFQDRLVEHFHRCPAHCDRAPGGLVQLLAGDAHRCRSLEVAGQARPAAQGHRQSEVD